MTVDTCARLEHLPWDGLAVFCDHTSSNLAYVALRSVTSVPPSKAIAQRQKQGWSACLRQSKYTMVHLAEKKISWGNFCQDGLILLLLSSMGLEWELPSCLIIRRQK